LLSFIAFFLSSCYTFLVRNETRNRILDSALRLFSAEGYTEVTTKAIADAAGVNEVTLFRHFGRKRDLYIEVYKTFAIQPSPDLLLGRVEYDLEKDLKLIGSIIADLVHSNFKIVTMSFKAVEKEIQEISDQLKKQMDDICVHIQPYFVNMKEKDKISGNPQELAFLFADMVFSLVIHRLRRGNTATLSEDVEKLSDIFARGITQPGRTVAAQNK